MTRLSRMSSGTRTALVLITALAGPLHAQNEECSAATGRLAGGLRTGAQFRSDVDRMQECSNGAATLAQVWNSAPAATEDLQALLDASLRFHDRRLLTSLQTTVRSAQPPNARIAALAATLSYVDSAMGVYLPQFLAENTSRIGAISVVSGASVILGESPPPPTARASVLSTLEQLAGTAENLQVRSAATRLQEAVYNVIDANTADVRLTYVCGNRFRVRNPNPVGIALRYEAGDTSDTETFTVPPRPYGFSFSEALIETRKAGTVRLFYDSSLIQTTANGRKECRGTGAK
jgi:hypothetical protein